MSPTLEEFTSNHRKTKRTFGQDLKAVREERRWTVHKAAQSTRVTEAIWREWEEDKRKPTVREFGLVLANLRAMRSWKWWINEQPVAVDAAPTTGAPKEEAPSKITSGGITGLTIAMALPATEAAMTLMAHGTFGEALKAEREAAKLTQTELANVLDITSGAVSFWESDKCVPVKDHYDKLVSLFPALATAPKPSVQEIDKPDGGSGIERPDYARRKPVNPPQAKRIVIEPTPVPSIGFDGLSFGKALTKIREAAGLERLDLAEKLDVSRRVVKGWELDERVPIPDHLDKILALFPALASFEFVAPIVTPPDPNAGPTFGAALRTEREHAGLRRTDLAKTIGRSHWTIQVWEQDRYPPKAEMHARLCEMFPALLTANKPSNHRPSPGETHAMAAATVASPVASVPTPAVPTSGIGGFIKLLAAARRVESSGGIGAVKTLLREAVATGASVSDLLLLLDGEGS